MCTTSTSSRSWSRRRRASASLAAASANAFAAADTERASLGVAVGIRDADTSAAASASVDPKRPRQNLSKKQRAKKQLIAVASSGESDHSFRGAGIPSERLPGTASVHPIRDGSVDTEVAPLESANSTPVDSAWAAYVPTGGTQDPFPASVRNGGTQRFQHLCGRTLM